MHESDVLCRQLSMETGNPTSPPKVVMKAVKEGHAEEETECVACHFVISYCVLNLYKICVSSSRSRCIWIEFVQSVSLAILSCV